MKRISILIILSCALLGTGWTQTVPQGMKYQAVARDLKGNVLADKQISLRINLYSDLSREFSAYSEIHVAQTNELGLFTLTIGEGYVQKGSFAEIPWSTKDIWMEIGIKEKEDSEFLTISNSRLLAVPYAFHAGTASKLIESASRLAEPGVPSNTWSLFGNSDSDDDVDRLGTTDCQDLVVITNNIERLRITCEGAVNIAGDLNVGNDLDVGNDVHIGNDLTVDQDVYLNVDGGETVVNGDLTVDNMSATELTGTLDVDKATTLNSTLYVADDATFDGEVEISGGISASSAYISGSASLDIGGQNYVACFENTDAASSGTDGIAIKIGSPGATSNWHDNSDNDYITFYNGQNQATGSVEGFYILTDNPLSTFPAPDFSDFFNILDFSGALTLPSIDWSNLISFDAPNISIDFTGLDFSFDPGGLSVDFANEFDPGGFDPGAFFNPSAALGATQSIADIVCWGIANGMESLITTNPFDLILAATVIAETNLCKENNGAGGVTYVSFGADYAEWLPRANANETMSRGQIVGVRNGRISKNTEQADQILAISTNPIVLGNKPPAGDELLYERVGFMGQVPVLVRGTVRQGDYIIPSGKNDGIGQAIRPDELTFDHIPLILGRAWSDSENDFISYINVAVGLNRNDIVKLTGKQEDKINELKAEIISLREGVQAQLSELSEKMKILEQDGDPGKAYVQRDEP